MQRIPQISTNLPLMIPFNKPYFTGKETDYIAEAVANGKISGNGLFTQKCQQFFERNYGFKKCLLTSSCTDALEMAAILLNISAGDEVIMPAYTFVSTANAFVLRGATIIFIDSRGNHPNIDVALIEEKITTKTKAIVAVHYAGMACDMEALLGLCKKHKIVLVEDAAQAIDNYYEFEDGRRQPLGSFGDLATFSFHETKNIIAGEGGMLVVNNIDLITRAEIIWEKGTNRKAFLHGEVNKYEWVDIGSSFLPSEITAAFLWAQIENLTTIQKKRKQLWDIYANRLISWGSLHQIKLPMVPHFSGNNGHIFYLVCNSQNQRDAFIEHCRAHNVHAIFHYHSLASSSFFTQFSGATALTNAEKYAERLVRLPLFFELDIEMVVDLILKYEG